jgi:hypothetical protein
MWGKSQRKIFLSACIVLTSLCLGAPAVHGQETLKVASPSPQPSETAPEVRALSELIYDLQAQVQTLNSQLNDLRTEQQRTSEEARELRRELDLVRVQTIPADKEAELYAKSSVRDLTGQPVAPPSPAGPQQPNTEDRIAKLEENQEIIDAKVNDQYQTKVESGSKYRLRLSGMVLLNLYENRGLVDNQDFPQLVEPPQSDPLYVSSGTFGGTLRQSQLKLQAFGPDIAGARTSADIEFDFAGGFPDQWNGVAMGLVRLRTGTIRLDWTNTSIVAGQDSLFFVPLAPTSLATLATPALSYAGNLWAWTPQVRVEHRIPLSDVSNIVLEAGILDSLTGDVPEEGYDRYPTWGELSGQPAYATRIAWSHHVFGQDLTIGGGGYYGRQDWGFGRTVDGWAGTTDVTLPLGKRFEFTGAFYRGRAVAGLGGGIGQSVLLNGSFIAPATTFWGLDSAGGWTQLKFKATTKLEINGAVGVDNPFASEMRLHKANSIYPDLYTRNLSPFLNFIYRIRSDVLISMEYRWLQTSVLGGNPNSAGHINLSMGYIF